MRRSSHTERGASTWSAPAPVAPPPVALPEYRPDSVTVLRDRNGKVVSAVILEVRLEIDEASGACGQCTWPPRGRASTVR